MLDFFKTLTGQHRLEYENSELKDKVDWQSKYINELIREQRSHNKARAVIQETPQFDYTDPEYQTFDDFLEGRLRFEELEGMKAVNWFIKFHELIQRIAYEHYYSFGDGDIFDNVDLVLEEIHAGGFSFTAYNTCDQSGDRYSAGRRYFVPIDFLWTDWKQRCDDELARKKAEQERKRAENLANQEEWRAKREAERYQQAKQLIKKYEDKDGSDID